METALASYFDWRVHMIVPNVSYGLQLHECDLLVVTKCGYATEIEIKISRADLKKDSSKWHGHKSKKIKRLFFAIPEHLAHCHEFIPAHAGILHVYSNAPGYGWRVKHVRDAVENEEHRKLTDEERMHLGYLATTRIWTMRNTITGLTNDIKYLITAAEEKDIALNRLQQAAVVKPEGGPSGEPAGDK